LVSKTGFDLSALRKAPVGLWDYVAATSDPSVRVFIPPSGTGRSGISLFFRTNRLQSRRYLPRTDWTWEIPVRLLISHSPRCISPSIPLFDRVPSMAGRGDQGLRFFSSHTSNSATISPEVAGGIEYYGSLVPPGPRACYPVSPAATANPPPAESTESPLPQVGNQFHCWGWL